MKSIFLELSEMKTISKAGQAKIKGGNPDPIGGDGGGGSGGGGSSSNTGICYENGNSVRVPCDQYCSDGTQPICGF
ncbi:hypothetical protein ACJRPK_05470 [Aquimarina sp. 2-A2]|uniref:hypothetical protein n=1 Tax=Aquimarina sp. 2-A2 TaxID=3382644 RepID=UPI00387EFF0D